MMASTDIGGEPLTRQTLIQSGRRVLEHFRSNRQLKSAAHPPPLSSIEALLPPSLAISKELTKDETTTLYNSDLLTIPSNKSTLESTPVLSDHALAQSSIIGFTLSDSFIEADKVDLRALDPKTKESTTGADYQKPHEMRANIEEHPTPEAISQEQVQNLENHHEQSIDNEGQLHHRYKFHYENSSNLLLSQSKEMDSTQTFSQWATHKESHPDANVDIISPPPLSPHLEYSHLSQPQSQSTGGAEDLTDEQAKESLHLWLQHQGRSPLSSLSYHTFNLLFNDINLLRSEFNTLLIEYQKLIREKEQLLLQMSYYQSQGNTTGSSVLLKKEKEVSEDQDNSRNLEELKTLAMDKEMLVQSKLAFENEMKEKMNYLELETLKLLNEKEDWSKEREKHQHEWIQWMNECKESVEIERAKLNEEIFIWEQQQQQQRSQYHETDSANIHKEWENVRQGQLRLSQDMQKFEVLKFELLDEKESLENQKTELKELRLQNSQCEKKLNKEREALNQAKIDSENEKKEWIQEKTLMQSKSFNWTQEVQIEKTSMDEMKAALESEKESIISQKKQIELNTIETNQRYAAVKIEKEALIRDQQQLDDQRQMFFNDLQLLNSDRLELENEKGFLEAERKNLLLDKERFHEEQKRSKEDNNIWMDEKVKWEVEINKAQENVNHQRSIIRDQMTMLNNEKEAIHYEKNTLEAEGIELNKKKELIYKESMALGKEKEYIKDQKKQLDEEYAIYKQENEEFENRKTQWSVYLDTENEKLAIEKESLLKQTQEWNEKIYELKNLDLLQSELDSEKNEKKVLKQECYAMTKDLENAYQQRESMKAEVESLKNMIYSGHSIPPPDHGTLQRRQEQLDAEKKDLNKQQAVLADKHTELVNYYEWLESQRLLLEAERLEVLQQKEILGALREDRADHWTTSVEKKDRSFDTFFVDEESKRKISELQHSLESLRTDFNEKVIELQEQNHITASLTEKLVDNEEMIKEYLVQLEEKNAVILNFRHKENEYLEELDNKQAQLQENDNIVKNLRKNTTENQAFIEAYEHCANRLETVVPILMEKLEHEKQETPDWTQFSLGNSALNERACVLELGINQLEHERKEFEFDKSKNLVMTKELSLIMDKIKNFKAQCYPWLGLPPTTPFDEEAADIGKELDELMEAMKTYIRLKDNWIVSPIKSALKTTPKTSKNSQQHKIQFSEKIKRSNYDYPEESSNELSFMSNEPTSEVFKTPKSKLFTDDDDDEDDNSDDDDEPELLYDHDFPAAKSPITTSVATEAPSSIIYKDAEEKEWKINDWEGQSLADITTGNISYYDIPESKDIYNTQKVQEQWKQLLDKCKALASERDALIAKVDMHKKNAQGMELYAKESEEAKRIVEEKWLDLDKTHKELKKRLETIETENRERVKKVIQQFEHLRTHYLHQMEHIFEEMKQFTVTFNGIQLSREDEKSQISNLIFSHGNNLRDYVIEFKDHEKLLCQIQLSEAQLSLTSQIQAYAMLKNELERKEENLKTYKERNEEFKNRLILLERNVQEILQERIQRAAFEQSDWQESSGAVGPVDEDQRLENLLLAIQRPILPLINNSDRVEDELGGEGVQDHENSSRLFLQEKNERSMDLSSLDLFSFQSDSIDDSASIVLPPVKDKKEWQNRIEYIFSPVRESELSEDTPHVNGKGKDERLRDEMKRTEMTIRWLDKVFTEWTAKSHPSVSTKANHEVIVQSEYPPWINTLKEEIKTSLHQRDEEIKNIIQPMVSFIYHLKERLNSPSLAPMSVLSTMDTVDEAAVGDVEKVAMEKVKIMLTVFVSAITQWIKDKLTLSICKMEAALDDLRMNKSTVSEALFLCLKRAKKIEPLLVEKENRILLLEDEISKNEVLLSQVIRERDSLKSQLTTAQSFQHKKQNMLEKEVIMLESEKDKLATELNYWMEMTHSITLKWESKDKECNEAMANLEGAKYQLKSIQSKLELTEKENSGLVKEVEQAKEWKDKALSMESNWKRSFTKSRYWKARCRKEIGYRSDLIYQKKYLLLAISSLQASEQTTMNTLSQYLTRQNENNEDTANLSQIIVRNYVENQKLNWFVGSGFLTTPEMNSLLSEYAPNFVSSSGIDADDTTMDQHFWSRKWKSAGYAVMSLMRMRIFAEKTNMFMQNAISGLPQWSNYSLNEEPPIHSSGSTNQKLLSSMEGTSRKKVTF